MTLSIGSVAPDFDPLDGPALVDLHVGDPPDLHARHSHGLPLPRLHRLRVRELELDPLRRLRSAEHRGKPYNVPSHKRVAMRMRGLRRLAWIVFRCHLAEICRMKCPTCAASVPCPSHRPAPKSALAGP